MENKNLKINNNAKAFKRILSFLIDNIFINFFIAITVQRFVFSSKNIEKINETMGEFKQLFGTVKITELKDYHIRFIVNSTIFDCFVHTLLITCFLAVLYNFFSYIFLKSSTFGQKILSLRVVNMKNDEKPNKLKLLLKAFLVQFPFALIYIMMTGQFLYLINFHLYAPMKNILTILLIKITAISNIYTIGIVLVVLFLFWFNVYYFTDKLILSDIISRTRVVNSKIIDIDNKDKKDFVFFADKLFDLLDKINNKLKKQLENWINYLKNKIKK